MFIVEDSDLVVTKLEKLLEPLSGVKIQGRASDEYTAVKMIDELNPDYVILDISLKYGHGLRVLEKIENMKNKPYVIVLTNLNYEFYKDKCLKLGADHFFDKAMEFEKVYDILSERVSKN
ncbi:MAG: response regulator [Chlorobi bacterium]|nr:response regulator [Chlorobiota bacterium]MCI0715725.1 response regulator [Chlorobiota bacterium]